MNKQNPIKKGKQKQSKNPTKQKETHGGSRKGPQKDSSATKKRLKAKSNTT
jgi:hypothetical protein